MAVEDMIDALTTHHILNLATTEVILGGECLCHLLVNLRHHRAPDLRLGLALRLVELDAEEESALECLVEGSRHITGANHDAIELLHPFEQDVLHAVVHLADSIAIALLVATTQDGIALVEEQDGADLASGDK